MLFLFSVRTGLREGRKTVYFLIFGLLVYLVCCYAPVYVG
jgi:hypothetical protein